MHCHQVEAQGQDMCTQREGQGQSSLSWSQENADCFPRRPCLVYATTWSYKATDEPKPPDEKAMQERRDIGAKEVGKGGITITF